MDSSKSVEAIKELLGKGEVTIESLESAVGNESLPDVMADYLLSIPADSDFGESFETLLKILPEFYSERLFTVIVGLLWREDVLWLKGKDSEGREARLNLLHFVAGNSPASLSPLFWRAVGEKGNDYLATAYDAIRDTYKIQAAPLLVKLCQETVEKRFSIEIRETVDSFLSSGDSAVRSAFLDAMRKVPQVPKRLIMTHLDISLMAELDSSAIEHKGKDFFYDEDSEKKKRDDMSKDIFSEVARRLERGEKP